MLDEGLSAADDEQGECERRHEMQNVDSVHLRRVLAHFGSLLLAIVECVTVHLRVATPPVSLEQPDPDRVPLMLRIPREVVDWIDKKASARFKRRATYVTDLIIGAYERDREKQS